MSDGLKRWLIVSIAIPVIATLLTAVIMNMIKEDPKDKVSPNFGKEILIDSLSEKEINNLFKKPTTQPTTLPATQPVKN